MRGLGSGRNGRGPLSLGWTGADFDPQVPQSKKSTRICDQASCEGGRGLNLVQIGNGGVLLHSEVSPAASNTKTPDSELTAATGGADFDL